jgi:hypothetical protein
MATPQEDPSMYFAPIMIDIKERFGHILKERGLVMRGSEHKGELNLEFRTGDENRRLAIRLDIRSKTDTRAKAARWKHASLTATIYEEVRLGDTGYYCFVDRQFDQVDPLDFDTEEEFAAEVGAYIKECVIVNFGEDEFAVADEIAKAYLAISEKFEPDAPEFKFERIEGDERLTVTDAAGRTLAFTVLDKKCVLQVSVDGEVVTEMSEPAQWKVNEVVDDHFTTACDLRAG